MLGVSNELKSGLWWASIAIAIVAVIIFAIYLIIVIWHYSLSLKEKKSKTEFNALINEINTKNFNYLETLAKKNEQLQKAIKLIADINSFYKSQLDELQLKIVDLSCIIDRYQLWRADKLHKQIKEDIHKCEQIAYTINSIYSNSTDYSLVASRILAKYRVAYNDIKDFYLNNLSNSFCK
ncbi:MAG: hypothetical protein HUJ52_04100, partial [Malacoplasma sp.]|nr:hypothetical protein [Malacoplasma sp.]